MCLRLCTAEMVIDRKKNDVECVPVPVRSWFGLANNKILDLDFGSWTFDSNLFQCCGKYCVAYKFRCAPKKCQTLG